MVLTHFRVLENSQQHPRPANVEISWKKKRENTFIRFYSSSFAYNVTSLSEFWCFLMSHAIFHAVLVYLISEMATSTMRILFLGFILLSGLDADWLDNLISPKRHWTIWRSRNCGDQVIFSTNFQISFQKCYSKKSFFGSRWWLPLKW